VSILTAARWWNPYLEAEESLMPERPKVEYQPPGSDEWRLVDQGSQKPEAGSPPPPGPGLPSSPPPSLPASPAARRQAQAFLRRADAQTRARLQVYRERERQKSELEADMAAALGAWERWAAVVAGRKVEDAGQRFDEAKAKYERFMRALRGK
jgi:hypothetical protein